MIEQFKQLKGNGSNAFDGIPENYFAGLLEKLINRVNNQPKAKKPVYLQSVFLSVAASLVIFIALGVAIFFLFPDSRKDLLIANKEPEIENELIVHNNTPESPFKDTIISEKHPDDTITTERHQDDAPTFENTIDDLDKLFAPLDDIPVETIIEYLITTNEFEF
ncbi:MAG TPA: hypothetical protein ENN08_06045 [Bacteroidales bacterium]|nr:hypothetical protein [Bacteroidales bacterium]